MKKTLIALALAALPVAAMADVTLYGQIKGGVEYTKVKNGESATNLMDYGSRIGFKGTEDLGNGLKAIWQVEQKVALSPALGTKGFGTRDTFIGLQGGFGTLRAGNLSNSLDEMSSLDQWDGSEAGMGEGVRNLGYYTRHEGRATAVRYDSPDIAGFSFNAYYAPKVNRNLDEEVTVKGGKPVYQDVASIGIGYENSGFFAKYGFKRNNFVDGAVVASRVIKDEQIHRLELGYDANNLFAGIGFQYDKNYVKNNGKGGYNLLVKNGKEVAASLAYTAGNVTPKLSYAHAFKSGDFRGYDQAIIGVDYAFSKRTTALLSAGWLRLKENRDTVTTTYSVGAGLKHKF